VLERVLDVTDAKPVLSDEDADHVEPQGVEMWVAVGEVLHGELAEGGLFAGRDGFEWVAVGGPAAQLNSTNTRVSSLRTIRSISPRLVL
jgi:hypothetical protein